MVNEHNNTTDGEMVETPVSSHVTDELRAIFAGAIRGVMESMPDDAVRRLVVVELMRAHKNAEAAIARRRLN